jgi:hypothetical protein
LFICSRGNTYVLVLVDLDLPLREYRSRSSANAHAHRVLHASYTAAAPKTPCLESLGKPTASRNLKGSLGWAEEGMAVHTPRFPRRCYGPIPVDSSLQPPACSAVYRLVPPIFCPYAPVGPVVAATSSCLPQQSTNSRQKNMISLLATISRRRPEGPRWALSKCYYISPALLSAK